MVLKMMRVLFLCSNIIACRRRQCVSAIEATFVHAGVTLKTVELSVCAWRANFCVNEFHPGKGCTGRLAAGVGAVQVALYYGRLAAGVCAVQVVLYYATWPLWSTASADALLSPGSSNWNKHQQAAAARRQSTARYINEQ